MEISFIVKDKDEGLRMDVYLTRLFEDYSRTYLAKLIKEDCVKVNGESKQSKYKVKIDDDIVVNIPQIIVPDITPCNIPVDIVYEDNDIIVVNKEKGMVVHPAPGNYTGTLVNALLFHTEGGLSDINGVERPGIVHRIDKDTSGLLVVAKNNNAHRKLSELFAVHDITREYIAIVKGMIGPNGGNIDAPIGRDVNNRLKMAVDTKNGKHAVTHFTVVERLKGATFIKVHLETGRTHQIRVHMAYIGYPVLGDDIYGGKDPRFDKGQLLHARLLGFVHPSTEKYVEYTAEPGAYFNDALDLLRKD